MSNQGLIIAAVIGIAAVGAYVLNLGGIKDKINSLLSSQGIGKPQCMALGLCVQGYKWDATACKCVPSSTTGTNAPAGIRAPDCGHSGFPPCPEGDIRY